MLIDAVAILAKQRPDARVLVVGGEPAQVADAKARAAAAGAAATMVFTGQQPAKEIPGFVQAADLLVSPRIRGTNTPLKIYSYLRSGKAIVATNLLTHTQVLTPEIARLVDPQPGPFAAAMLELIEQPAERERLARQAAAVAEEKYSRQSYLRRTALAYERLAQSRRGSPELTGAKADSR
jgi:glycosyltransferase involved in cell wall biosynthesis